MAQGRQSLAWVVAARLSGAAETLRETFGISLHPAERVSHDQAMAAVRTGLGEAGFVAAWAEGRALSLEKAVALALEERADRG
jgi:hypothetical protein